MNPEEIKVGEKINIEALVVRKLHSEEQLITCELPTGLQVHIWQRYFKALSPADGIKSAKNAPKYDPCRLLRKGDKVQVKRRDGRCNGKDGEYLREAFCTVIEDETRNELVRVLHNCTEYRLDPAYLELVDPVEELEPYFVAYDDKFYHVHKKGEDAALAVYYEAKHPHAKEAAEAECDRLNAEYIKELQSNI